MWLLVLTDWLQRSLSDRPAGRFFLEVLHIIETHREQLELVAQTLIEVETIDRKEIVALYQFGKMPKDLDEKEAEQLDKVVNKKYYEEQARLAQEEAAKEAKVAEEKAETTEEVEVIDVEAKEIESEEIPSEEIKQEDKPSEEQ